MLPKLEHVANEIEVKSLGKKFKFRPILVKEEKLLLIAKESENDKDIFSAIKQVVANCALDETFDVDKLPIYELEWIFLRLRVQSIGGVVELAYHDNEDDQDYRFKIELDEIKLIYPEGSEPKIEVTPDVGILLRHPPATLYENDQFLNNTSTTDAFEQVLFASIDSIWEGEEVHVIGKDTDREELKEFIDSLEPDVYRKIQTFFLSVPHMHYQIDYKNKNGTERNITLRTLADFFIL